MNKPARASDGQRKRDTERERGDDEQAEWGKADELTGFDNTSHFLLHTNQPTCSSSPGGFLSSLTLDLALQEPGQMGLSSRLE